MRESDSMTRVSDLSSGAVVPFHEVVRRLREAMKCPTCGKTQAVVNVARRGYVAERVTPETHCMCPGSPAAQFVRPQGGVA